MFVIGVIQAGIFLGSWNDPFGLIGYFHERFIAQNNAWGLLVVNLLACGVLITKGLGIIFVQMWIRWTLPRPRIDQVLYACVKVLLPMACALLIGAAAWGLFIPARMGVPWHDYNPFHWADWNGVVPGLITQVILSLVLIGGLSAVVAWVMYAFVTRGQVRQRLSEAAPIPVIHR
jgi:hypothetical protein